MERTKKSSAQKKYYILKDNIYLRVVTRKDLKQIDQIVSVVNSAYIKNAGWTSIASFVYGDRVTPNEIKNLIYETIDYEKTKTQLLCMFERHPTKSTKSNSNNNNNNGNSTEREEYDETAIGTYLIKGGGTAFPANAQRTDQSKNEIYDNECYHSLYCISPTYQSQGLGSKLQNAGCLYARDILGYKSAIVWAFEGRTPELLTWYQKMGWQNIGTMEHPKPYVLKDKSTRYLLLKRDLTLIKKSLL